MNYFTLVLMWQKKNDLLSGGLPNPGKNGRKGKKNWDPQIFGLRWEGGHDLGMIFIWTHPLTRK